LQEPYFPVHSYGREVADARGGQRLHSECRSCRAVARLEEET